jgi:hypothetical protein
LDTISFLHLSENLSTVCPSIVFHTDAEIILLVSRSDFISSL